MFQEYQGLRQFLSPLASHVQRLRGTTVKHMKTLEEETANLKRLLKATRKGDVAAVRALLDSGDVDVNRVDKVRDLRQTACSFV
jgi:hypothetical protein